MNAVKKITNALKAIFGGDFLRYSTNIEDYFLRVDAGWSL